MSSTKRLLIGISVVILLSLLLGSMAGYYFSTSLSNNSESTDKITREKQFLSNGFLASRLSGEFRGTEYQYRIEFVLVSDQEGLSVIEDYGPMFMDKDIIREIRLVGIIETPREGVSHGSFTMEFDVGGSWSGRPTFQFENTGEFGRVTTEIDSSDDVSWVDNRITLVQFRPERNNQGSDSEQYRLDIVRQVRSD